MTSIPVKKSKWQIIVSYIVAALVITGFFALCFFMISKGLSLTAAEEFKWSRMVFVFSAVQAIATASAGILLGTSVAMNVANGRVADAKGEAQKDRAKAKENQVDAEKARAARRIIGELQPPGNNVDSRSTASQAQLDAIVRLLED
jgi:hypothetical protein